MPGPDATEVVRRLGGVADWRQVLRHTTSHSVRQALTRGNLHRVGRGVYALPELPLAAHAAAATGGLISHRSAADHWLMEGLSKSESADVLIPPHARPTPRKGVRLHYGNVPAADDHGGVTSPLRTVLDCAATMPFAEALAIADSALRRDLVNADQLLGAALSRKGRGRRRIISVAEAADGRAANPFESGLRAIVVSAGIRGFVPQQLVQTQYVRARVDLGDAGRRIALEADSFTFHGTRSGLVRDCDRYDELVRAGWLVLRFSWEHVMFSADWVMSVVADTCSLRNPAR